jgi:hypothetical protein
MIAVRLLALLCFSAKSIFQPGAMPSLVSMVSTSVQHSHVQRKVAEEIEVRVDDARRQADSSAQVVKKHAESLLISQPKKPIPTPKLTAYLNLVVSVLNEEKTPVPVGLPFVVTWKFVDTKGKRGALSSRTIRCQSNSKGQIEVPNILSVPGFISIELDSVTPLEWSFKDSSHEAIPVPQILANDSKPLRRVVGPSVVLQRDFVDLSFDGAPSTIAMEMPNGRRIVGTRCTIQKALAEDPRSSILLSDNRDGVERIAEIKLSSVSTRSPYRLNKILVKPSDWKTNSLPGFTSPLMAPIDVTGHAKSPLGLEDMLDLKAFEQHFGAVPLTGPEQRKLSDVGNVVPKSVSSPPYDLTIRSVRFRPKDSDKVGHLNVIEQLAIRDTKAGDVAKIRVGDTMASIVKRLGPPESQDANGNLAYFDGGLVFEPNGDNLNYIRFHRPLEFLRDGLRPVPIRALASIRVEGLDENNKIQSLICTANADPSTLAASSYKDAISLGLSVKSALSQNPDIVEPIDGGDYGIDIKVTDAGITPFDLEQRWTAACTVQVYDRRSSRPLNAVRIEAKDEHYVLPVEAETAHSKVVSELVAKVVDYVQRISIVGRLASIDAKANLIVEFDNWNMIRQGDTFRLRNFDQAALDDNIVAFVVEKPGGKRVRCEFRRLIREGKTQVPSPRLLEQYANSLLDPATNLVFADYLPAYGEYHNIKRAGEGD